MARIVARCGKSPEFSYQCNKTWGDLAPIGGCKDSRFCEDCRKPVFFVRDDAGFSDAIDKGLCVAIDVETDDGEDFRLLGIPAPR